MEFMYVRLKDKIKSGDISNSFTNVTTHFLKRVQKYGLLFPLRFFLIHWYFTIKTNDSVTSAEQEGIYRKTDCSTSYKSLYVKNKIRDKHKE